VDGLARVRANILAASGIAETLVTRAGDAALIRADVQLRDDNHAALDRFLRTTRALVDASTSGDPNLSVSLVGLVPLNDAFIQATRSDMRVLFPAMGVLFLAGLFVFTKSPRGVAGPLIIVVAAVTAAIGAAGWLRIPVTPILSIAPTIILGIGIADSLHILVGVDRARLAGAAPRPALYKTMRRNLGPIGLTTLTTGVGFLCLMFSESPPFRDLGLVTAIGVFAALFFTLTLLPVISLVAPGKIRSRYDQMGRWIGGVADHAACRRPAALMVIGALVAIAGSGLSQLRGDDRLSEWFDNSLAFKRDVDAVRDRFRPTEQVSWVIPLPGGSNDIDAAFLENLDRFSSWLRDQPEVAGAVSLSSMLDVLSRDGTPANKIAILDGLRRFKDGRDRLSPLWSTHMDETRVIVTPRNESTQGLRALAVRAKSWTSQRSGPIGGARPSGPTWSLAMLVPPAMIYGVWSWTGRPIGLAESVVAATSLGLLVDTSIHIFTRFQARSLQGLDPRARIRRAFETAGPALLTGYLILIAGFAVLSLSPFRGNMHFGLLTAATLAVGLPVAVLTLPLGLARAPITGDGNGDQSIRITPGSTSSSL
jgi:predicted RND superfamily exporter protein